MSTRPSNFQEINDKFWIALGLYCVSMVLVGYAVYTNVKASYDIGLANISVANANISTLRRGNEDLNEHIANLNSMVGKIDTLNKEVLRGSILAEAEFRTLKEKYDTYLMDLKQEDSGDPELRQSVIKAYENFVGIISVSKVFMEEKIDCDKEMREMRLQHDRDLREKDNSINDLRALIQSN